MFAVHVESIDTFIEYVDFFVIYRQVGSIGRRGRHKREPRTGLATTRLYALPINIGEIAMGKIRLAWLVPVFSIVLTACGGSSGGGGTSPPPPPPPPAATPAIDVEHVFTGLTFNGLVSLQQAPGDATRWFAVEQSGRILEFANDQGVTTATTFLDINVRVISGGERGLLGIAFDPLFPTVEDVYVSYTGNNAGGNLISVLSRFALMPGGQSLDPASEQILLTVPQDQNNHNGGHIEFGPDGYLYLGLGDGGGSGDPLDRAQATTDLLGSMVRIDVDTGVPYAIPADNPFSANQTCPQGTTTSGQDCPEIFAWGLRNPWRFSFDSQTDVLWLGDVGQARFEEIDIITAGGNYGWDDREGAHCFEPTIGCIMDSIDPITEYSRALGASVTGGFVYRGSAIPDLVGWYVYGDFVSGRIFGIPADSQTGTETIVLLETTLSISTFAQDENGELYVIDYGSSSTIHRITDAP
jgi:glucose/arabinose dehydrogenase